MPYLIANLEVSIIAHEGLGLVPYRDSRGIWSIGYGHKILSHEDFSYPITPPEAEALLQKDLNIAIESTEKSFSFYEKLSDNRKSILAEMVYQMGAEKVLTFHDMINEIELLNFQEAALQMIASKWYKETPNRVIILAYRMQSDTFAI